MAASVTINGLSLPRPRSWESQRQYEARAHVELDYTTWRRLLHLTCEASNAEALDEIHRGRLEKLSLRDRETLRVDTQARLDENDPDRGTLTRYGDGWRAYYLRQLEHLDQLAAETQALEVVPADEQPERMTEDWLLANLPEGWGYDCHASIERGYGFIVGPRETLYAEGGALFIPLGLLK